MQDPAPLAFRGRVSNSARQGIAAFASLLLIPLFLPVASADPLDILCDQMLASSGPTLPCWVDDDQPGNCSVFDEQGPIKEKTPDGKIEAWVTAGIFVKWTGRKPGGFQVPWTDHCETSLSSLGTWHVQVVGDVRCVVTATGAATECGDRVSGYSFDTSVRLDASCPSGTSTTMSIALNAGSKGGVSVSPTGPGATLESSREAGFSYSRTTDRVYIGTSFGVMDSDNSRVTWAPSKPTKATNYHVEWADAVNLHKDCKVDAIKGKTSYQLWFTRNNGVQEYAQAEIQPRDGVPL